MYSLEEATSLILKAGDELVKRGLVARTWGNISARLSEKQFLITPSGIPYDQLNKDNLVICEIEDCSYNSNIKPSGERKVHAAIYKIKKDVNFIVHTHQNYATAISVDGLDKPFASVAKYGLPGTKGLVKNVIKAVLKKPNNPYILMARHGAVIYESSYEEAFKKSSELEELSLDLFNKNKTDKDNKIIIKPYLDDYAQMFGYDNDNLNEDDVAKELVRKKNALAAEYQKKPKSMKWLDVKLQHFVYKKKYAKLKDKNK